MKLTEIKTKSLSTVKKWFETNKELPSTDMQQLETDKQQLRTISYWKVIGDW